MKKHVLKNIWQTQTFGERNTKGFAGKGFSLCMCVCVCNRVLCVHVFFLWSFCLQITRGYFSLYPNGNSYKNICQLLSVSLSLSFYSKWNCFLTRWDVVVFKLYNESKFSLTWSFCYFRPAKTKIISNDYSDVLSVVEKGKGKERIYLHFPFGFPLFLDDFSSLGKIELWPRIFFEICNRNYNFFFFRKSDKVILCKSIHF